MRGFRIELGEIEAALRATPPWPRPWCCCARTGRATSAWPPTWGSPREPRPRPTPSCSGTSWSASPSTWCPPFSSPSRSCRATPIARWTARPWPGSARLGGPRPGGRRAGRPPHPAGRGAGRPLVRGPGGERGWSLRRLLRAGRPLAARHPARDARFATRSESSCRCGPSSRPRPWRGRPSCWRRRGRRRVAAGAADPPRDAVRATCRSRSPRSASGSSTSSPRGARPTTCRRLSPCAAGWTSRPWSGPSPRWCGATRPCAPPSRHAGSARCRRSRGPPAGRCR